MLFKQVDELIRKQDQGVETAKEICRIKYGPETLNSNTTPIFNDTVQSWMCPAYFDSVACWPPAQANSMVAMPCPSYIIGFDEGFNATKQCLFNGRWFTNEQNHIWTNYTMCSVGDTATIFTAGVNNSEGLGYIKDIISTLKVVSLSGYALSFVSLVVAFCIMFFIKKLHCARNILHMNLFASFILRALIHILKDILFVDGLGFPKDFISENGDKYFITDINTNNYECKLMTSLVQYFTTANYSWILMEGLYLNNLIFRALFADSRKMLKPYIILGWGLPLLVVIPWIIARILFEDNYCWTTNDNYLIFLIIGIPTMISVMINFVLFIIISIVLYTKLRSPVNEDSRRYQKWAKSTLVLVPLFGVHYAVLLIFYFVGKTEIWIICDTLFGSFQGFFVAVLYCFLNGEVKAELKPYLYTTLTFMATNKVFKYCFPCRQKYLRSAVGRQSVCTTLSCSSLYNNGIHRNSRQRLDAINKHFEKPKYNNVQEKNNKDHICNNGIKHSRAYSKSNYNIGNEIDNKFGPPLIHINNRNAETSLCMEQKPIDKEVIEHSCLEEMSMLGRTF